MRLVEEAQRSTSRTQVLADRAAGWLFYVAVGAAAVTATAWTVATTFDATVVERVVTVILEGSASEEQRAAFADAWHRRVQVVLNDDSLFTVETM